MIRLGGRFYLCVVRGANGVTHLVTCCVDYKGKPTKECKRVLCGYATGVRRYLIDGFPSCVMCINEGDEMIAHARTGAYGPEEWFIGKRA